MEESIIPWDGVVTNPRYLLDDDNVSNGMFMIRGSFSMQPYCCIIDTRNDTWFSIDTMVWKNKPVVYDHIPSYVMSAGERTQREEKRERKRPKESFQEQNPELSEDNLFPILPSFLDESGEKSTLEETPFVPIPVPLSERLVWNIFIRNSKSRNSEGDDDMKYFQERLNNIIDTHNLLTGKLELLAQEVGMLLIWSFVESRWTYWEDMTRDLFYMFYGVCCLFDKTECSKIIIT